VRLSPAFMQEQASAQSHPNWGTAWMDACKEAGITLTHCLVCAPQMLTRSSSP
jgi:hypothetical protein